MKNYTNNELEKILDMHKEWVKKGKGEIADLSNVDMSNVDLSNTNLHNVDLNNSDLNNSDLRNADLSNTNLSSTNLHNTNLSNTNLNNAYLCNADLSNAYLSNAYLINADLSNADLRNADLRNADLHNVDLHNTIGNGKEVKTLLCFEPYIINYTAENLQIGCKNYPIKDWWGFTNKEILEMDGKIALGFWNNYKSILMKIIELSPAT